jgi:Protein phosphatase 2C
MRRFRNSSGGAGPGTEAVWSLFAESARGASHVMAGIANQDSYGSTEFEFGGGRAVLAAVADGHGSRRHFRSALGSRFAVDVAHGSVLCALSDLGPDATSSETALEIKDLLILSIVDRWRTSVNEHLSSFPFTAEEDSMRLNGDDPEIAYGSTLLLALWTGFWVLCLQIGDGDIIAMHRDRTVELPVPPDPNIVGHRTTSLCQPNVTEAFRYGLIDSESRSPLAVLLATDGYANSYVGENWQGEVGAEIVDLLETKGSDWVKNELPSWVSRCASNAGSGDDTTVALVVRVAEDGAAV